MPCKRRRKAHRRRRRTQAGGMTRLVGDTTKAVVGVAALGLTLNALTKLKK